MIVEAVAAALSSLFSAVGHLLPDMEVPAWVVGFSGTVDDLTVAMAPLGNWVPFSAVGKCLALVATALAVALGIRIIRVLVSLFLGGGGGAA